MLLSVAMAAAVLAQTLPLRGLQHRPVYHLLSQSDQAGWMSDPNGPIFYKGRWHMFYQGATADHMRAVKQPFHTPDPVSWGHMSSADLTRWKQHPMAISPAAPTSYEGADVYSGAMIEDPTTGSVKAFYACGIGAAKPPGGHNDAVCYAESNADATDPNITKWKKFAGAHGSVVLYVPEALARAGKEKDYIPEAGSQFIFQNFTSDTCWNRTAPSCLANGWVMMVGSAKTSGVKRPCCFTSECPATCNKRGEPAALLFSAPDLLPTSEWSFQGEMFAERGETKIGGAWCPYIASLGNTDPGSPTGVALVQNNWIGRGQISPPSYKFTPANASQIFPLLDQGTAHVSAVFVGQQPFAADHRSVVMRWLTGPPTCQFMPGTATEAAAAPTCDKAHADACFVDWGWVGTHSLPMTINAATHGDVMNSEMLAYAPVDEVESLRLPGTNARSTHSASRNDGSVQWHAAAKGSATELRLNVTLPPSHGSPKVGECNAGLVVRASTDGSERTTIALWSSTRVDLIVNQTLSSRSNNQTKGILERPLPSSMLGRENSLRVFIDKSVIEVFVGTHTILSTRVYPMAGDAADMIGTFTSGGGCQLGPLESWQMEDVYADRRPLKHDDGAAQQTRTVMAWIADIANDAEYTEVVEYVLKNNASFNAVSDTTLYSVAANASVVRNLHNIQRHGVWKGTRFRTFPCVYGHTDLDTMRLVWANPEPFISTLLTDAREHSYTGINLDFEAFGNVSDPSAPPHFEDGVAYAAFLKRFSEEAARAGVLVSADVDTPAGECDVGTGRNNGKPCPWYTQLYNWQRLAVSGSKLLCMSTYTDINSKFKDHVLYASWFAKRQSVGFGICPTCLQDAGITPNASFLDYRFDLIAAEGFSEVDVWVLGYKTWKDALSPWMGHLKRFLSPEQQKLLKLKVDDGSAMSWSACTARTPTWHLTAVVHGTASAAVSTRYQLRSGAQCLTAAAALGMAECSESDVAQQFLWNVSAPNGAARPAGSAEFVESANVTACKQGGAANHCCLTNNGGPAALWGCCPNGPSACANQRVTLSSSRHLMNAGKCLGPPAPPPPPFVDTFNRSGVMDFRSYESTPLLFKGQRLLMETITLSYPRGMQHWKPSQYASCSSYYRIRSLDTGRVLSNISSSCNHSFGSAFVDVLPSGEEKLWVFGAAWWRPQSSSTSRYRSDGYSPKAKGWTGGCAKDATCEIGSFSTLDLKTWNKSVALMPGRSTFNVDVTKGKNGIYVMAAEQHPLPGAPPGSGWTSYFYMTASSDMTGWKVLDTKTHVIGGPGTHGACPTIRWVPEDAHYYVISGGLSVYLDRSRDLSTWQPSAQNGIVLKANFTGDTQQRLPWYTPEASIADPFTHETEAQMLAPSRAKVWDHDASDVDVWQTAEDELTFFYLCGDQGTTIFACLGTWRGELAQWFAAQYADEHADGATAALKTDDSPPWATYHWQPSTPVDAHADVRFSIGALRRTMQCENCPGASSHHHVIIGGGVQDCAALRNLTDFIVDNQVANMYYPPLSFQDSHLQPTKNSTSMRPMFEMLADKPIDVFWGLGGVDAANRLLANRTAFFGNVSAKDEAIDIMDRAGLFSSFPVEGSGWSFYATPAGVVPHDLGSGWCKHSSYPVDRVSSNFTKAEAEALMKAVWLRWHHAVDGRISSRPSWSHYMHEPMRWSVNAGADRSKLSTGFEINAGTDQQINAAMARGAARQWGARW